MTTVPFSRAGPGRAPQAHASQGSASSRPPHRPGFGSSQTPRAFQTFSGLEQTSGGLEESSPSFEQTSRGLLETLEDLLQTSEGLEQTSRGPEKTLEGP